MRGDQLVRQWRIIRAIEASPPNGLTGKEIAQREGTGIRTIYRDLEGLRAADFPLCAKRVEKANRWAFIGTFKFETPLPFTLTEFMSLFFFKDVMRVLKGSPFYNYLESALKKVQSIEINLWEMGGDLCSHIATVENKHVVKNLILLRDISEDLQSTFTCVFNGSIWRT